jgi:hypothetical protein
MLEEHEHEKETEIEKDQKQKRQVGHSASQSATVELNRLVSPCLAPLHPAAQAILSTQQPLTSNNLGAFSNSIIELHATWGARYIPSDPPIQIK